MDSTESPDLLRIPGRQQSSPGRERCGSKLCVEVADLVADAPATIRYKTTSNLSQDVTNWYGNQKLTQFTTLTRRTCISRRGVVSIVRGRRLSVPGSTSALRSCLSLSALVGQMQTSNLNTAMSARVHHMLMGRGNRPRAIVAFAQCEGRAVKISASHDGPAGHFVRLTMPVRRLHVTHNCSLPTTVFC